MECKGLFDEGNKMDAQTQSKHRQEKLKHIKWNPASSQAKQADTAALLLDHQHDAHEVLGVPRGVNGASLRAAYLARVAEAHPDKPGEWSNCTWPEQHTTIAGSHTDQFL